MPNILIVDDDSSTRKLLQVLISRFGHEIFLAENLQEGLALVENNTIDIVFLDVMLPDGNGLEALPVIKQRPSSPEVIIITASESVAGAELAIKNGAWNYIQKPLSAEEITREALLIAGRICIYTNENIHVETLA